MTTSTARYVLFVLVAAYANTSLTRYLLNYLYAVSGEDYDDDDTKDYVSIVGATGISKSQYGILVGYGFTFSFVMFGLVMGRAADVYNRKAIIFCGMVIWNFATVCLGLSNNYTQLLLSQILLGIGQSCFVPASFSLIADYFPAESLAQANGIFVAGFYVGEGLSSLSIAVAECIGWRQTAYSVAASGFLLALLLCFTVKEPTRASAVTPTATTADSSASQGADQGARNPKGNQTFTVTQSLKLIFGDPLFLLMTYGGMLSFMAVVVLVSYLPQLYNQAYPDYNTEYSYLNAAVVLAGRALSSYLGGYVADRWEKAGENRARAYVPAIGALLGAPAFFMVIVIPSFYASMFFLFGGFLSVVCWCGLVMSVSQMFLPSRVRGVAVTSSLFCIMSASSLMAYVVGVILDTYTSDAALKRTLIVSISGMSLASSVVYFIASRFMPELKPGPLKESEEHPSLSNICHELEAGSRLETNPRPTSNDSTCSSRSSIQDTI